MAAKPSLDLGSARLPTHGEVTRAHKSRPRWVVFSNELDSRVERYYHDRDSLGFSYSNYHPKLLTLCLWVDSGWHRVNNHDFIRAYSSGAARSTRLFTLQDLNRNLISTPQRLDNVMRKCALSGVGSRNIMIPGASRPGLYSRLIRGRETSLVKDFGQG